jgi:hypothetical protein
MNEIRQSLLIGICLSSLGLSSRASAQSPEMYPQHSDPSAELMHREFVLRQLADGSVAAGQKSEDQLHARVLNTELRERMNHIAVLWKDLVEEYTTKNAFNIHTARELSKAFRELERTECWPKPIREK